MTITRGGFTFEGLLPPPQFSWVHREVLIHIWVFEMEMILLLRLHAVHEHNDSP